MRKYASLKIIKSIYLTIFDSYLSYCCLVWAQNCSTIQRIVILQKNAIRIINFQPWNSHTRPLFKQSSILKFQDEICLENILFVSKSLNSFPQISITVKPPVLHRVTSQNFFMRQIDMGSIQ